MSIAFRSRDRATEACPLCGVPAGTGCRSPYSAVPYPNLLHDIPLSILEDEKGAILEDMGKFLASQLQLAQLPKRARLSTANATPTTILDEVLPAQNGSIIYAEAFVAAATTAALPPTNWRLWRTAALLFRASGAWSVLGGGGGVAQLTVPPASAGASGWAMAPSLPGGDVLRLTVTGQAATAIGWVASIDFTIF